MTLLNVAISPVIEMPQGLRSSTQSLKSSSNSCLKFFVKINYAREKNALGSSAVCRLLYLYMKQAKAIRPLTFYFQNSFLIMKLFLINGINL